MADKIPLFPLEVVLFPGALLPLHIFEPRYRQMIAQCLANKEEFGVVLAADKGLASVGCTAEILKVLTDYPDGRKDIITIGKRRFRLLELLEDLPYLQVHVEWLALAADPAPRESGSLRDAYTRAYRLAYGRAPDPPDSGPDESVAFQMAQSLPLTIEFKQQLLQEDDELARRQQLEERLAELLPQLVSRDALRRRSRGNGHPA